MLTSELRDTELGYPGLWSASVFAGFETRRTTSYKLAYRHISLAISGEQEWIYALLYSFS